MGKSMFSWVNEHIFGCCSRLILNFCSCLSPYVSMLRSLRLEFFLEVAAERQGALHLGARLTFL